MAIEKEIAAVDLPIDNLTDVVYAFVDVDPATGIIQLEGTNNSSENFGNFIDFKRKTPGIGTFLSIGGPDYTANLANAASFERSRLILAQSAVKLMNAFNITGVDFRDRSIIVTHQSILICSRNRY